MQHVMNHETPVSEYLTSLVFDYLSVTSVDVGSNPQHGNIWGFFLRASPGMNLGKSQNPNFEI